MTDSLEVSKLRRSVGIEKGMYVQDEGKVVGFFSIVEFPFKVSKVRSVTTLAYGPTKPQG